MRLKSALCLFTLSLTASLVTAQETIIKIGHAAPLSGQIAHLGKDNENAARMAIDVLNAKGISIAGKKAKFVLLPEDDAANPQQATSVAQKLVDAKVNGIIGHLNSGTTIPASKIYNDAGIPQISPSATNPKYTQQGFKGVFRVVANDGQLGGTLLSGGTDGVGVAVSAAHAERDFALFVDSEFILMREPTVATDEGVHPRGHDRIAPR